MLYLTINTINVLSLLLSAPQGRDNNENYFNVTFISICRSLHPNANNTKPRRITRLQPLAYICNCEYGAFMYHNVNQ